METGDVDLHTCHINLVDLKGYERGRPTKCWAETQAFLNH